MMRSEFRMIRELEKRVDKLEGEAQPTVKFKRLSPNAVIPAYQTGGAAGLDLVAANEEPIMIHMGAQAVLVPLGFAMELPPGYEAQVRPRSGLAVKGVSVANSPGTIDEDYRGEVKVIIRNHGPMFAIHKGDRIAQMVIARVAKAKLETVDELTDTSRGAGGFGSTGK